MIKFLSILFFSFSALAETYHRGNQSCNFSKAKEYYKQDSENLRYQTLYGICLVIKGEDAQGLSMLYPLADFKSRVDASFFLAEYLSTEGKFTSHFSKKDINEALNYYFHTLALIALIPTYPEPEYWAYEKNYQMELNSIFRVSELYLWKYKLGAIGNYREHLFQTASYQGDRSKETYPKYNDLMKDSLDKALQHSTECVSMPQKSHFNPDRYKETIQSCLLLKELILNLIPLEEERQEILLQPNCKPLNKSDCLEYYETHSEIHNLMVNYSKT